MFRCWICSFLATCYLNSNESLLYRVYNITNRVPLCRNSIGPWLKLIQWGRGCGCAHGSWCHQHTLQYTWPLVTMQACFHDRIKNKNIVCDLYLTNSGFYIEIPDFIRFWDTVNSQLQEKKICHTILTLFSYLFLKIIFSFLSLIMCCSASTKPI